MESPRLPLGARRHFSVGVSHSNGERGVTHIYLSTHGEKRDIVLAPFGTYEGNLTQTRTAYAALGWKLIGAAYAALGWKLVGNEMVLGRLGGEQFFLLKLYQSISMLIRITGACYALLGAPRRPCFSYF